MTEDILKKAIRTIMSHDYNKKSLRLFEDWFGAMPEDEMLDEAVEEAYSPELLDEINRRMECLPVYSLVRDGLDTGTRDVLDGASAYKLSYKDFMPEPDDLVSAPLLWPRPAALIGEFRADCQIGFGRDFWRWIQYFCYMDDAGDIFFVRSYTDKLGHSPASGVSAVYRELLDEEEGDFPPTMEDLDEFLSEAFRTDFWSD